MTSVLFAINDDPRHFDHPPTGWDGSGGAGWILGRAGRLKGFALGASGHVAVDIEQDAFVGPLRSSSLVSWRRTTHESSSSKASVR